MAWPMGSPIKNPPLNSRIEPKVFLFLDFLYRSNAILFDSSVFFTCSFDIHSPFLRNT